MTEEERQAQVQGLAEDIRRALPTPGEAATSVATSTLGNLIAGAAIPLPLKLAVVGVGLAFVGWRWIKRKPG
jgi:uncharacterized membrane protein